MTDAGTDRERTAAGWLMTAFICASLWFGGTVFLTTMSIAGCSLACNFALQSWTVNGFLVFELALVSSVVIAFSARRRTHTRTWWIPAGGLVLLVAAGLTALTLSRTALGN